MSRFRKISKIISLLTWQTSLIISSIAFLIVSGVLVLASPETKQNIQDKALKIAKANFSDSATIEINNSLGEFDILVYDLLSENPTVPLDLDLEKNSESSLFSLFPGSYKIVFINQEDKTLVEKSFLVKVGEKKIMLKLDLSDLEEEEIEEEDDETQEEEEDSTENEDNAQQDYLPNPISSPINLPTTNIKSPQGTQTDLSVGELTIKDKYINSLKTNVITNNEKFLVEAEILNSPNTYLGSVEYSWDIYKDGVWQELFKSSKQINRVYQRGETLSLVIQPPEKPGRYTIRLQLNLNNLILESNTLNNRGLLDFSVVTEELCDLEMEDIRMIDTLGNYIKGNGINVGQTFGFEINIENKSLSKCNNSDIFAHFDYLDNTYSRFSIPISEVEAKAKLRDYIYFTPDKAGAWEVLFQINSTKLIKESNYNNNDDDFDFVVN